jgi:hypothetical protein
MSAVRRLLPFPSATSEGRSPPFSTVRWDSDECPLRADTFRSRGVANETDVPDCGRRRKPFVTRAMAASPRWRIHETSFHHILSAPPEPRRTVGVGEYPSFSGFSQLYTVIHLNLAYRWFCRLGLDGDVPDHSTFSKNRHGRFRESDLLRKLFETVVARCMKEGIVGGEAFAVDASIIVADAYRRRGVASVEDLDPKSSRAVFGSG